MKMEVSDPSEFDKLLSEQEYEKFLEESQWIFISWWIMYNNFC